MLFFRHFIGNCLQQIAGFLSWAKLGHFAPKLGSFPPKVWLFCQSLRKIIANIEGKLLVFEVGLILPQS